MGLLVNALFRRIAWRILANAWGGLSERARRRAAAISASLTPGFQLQQGPLHGIQAPASRTVLAQPDVVRFGDHPELEVSNNRAENPMRGVAVGRKNWIHMGSPQAGPKVAAILWVVETCRRPGVDPRNHLPDVLLRLADTGIQ